MAIDSLPSNSTDILEPPGTTISNMLDATGSYSPSTLIRTPSKRGDPAGHSEGSNDLDRLCPSRPIFLVEVASTMIVEQFSSNAARAATTQVRLEAFKSCGEANLHILGKEVTCNR